MRVLIAVHGLPTHSSGGAERVAERLAHWLVGEGHHVEVFTLDRLDDPDPHLTHHDESGVVVHRVSIDLGLPSPSLEDSYAHPVVGEAFCSVLAERRFDLVHVISGYLLGGQVIDLASQAGVPVVVTLTEYWFMCSRLNLIHPEGSVCTGPTSIEKCVWCQMREQRRYRIPAQIAPGLVSGLSPVIARSSRMQPRIDAMAQRQHDLKLALERASLVISPSKFLIATFAANGFDTRRFVYVGHGPEHPPALPQREPGSDRAVLRLGYMGQLKPHKGIDLLVDAVLSLLGQGLAVELDLWGTPDDETGYVSRLMRRTRQHPAIRWRGGFPGDTVWDVLADFDLLVVPSRWYENSPIVILEAFIAGVPVIATRLGGMAEMVDDGRNGLLFDLNDSADLAHQIERVLNDRALLQRLRDGIPDVRTAEDESREVFGLYSAVASAACHR